MGDRQGNHHPSIKTDVRSKAGKTPSRLGSVGEMIYYRSLPMLAHA
jgi:hypothetical protein